MPGYNDTIPCPMQFADTVNVPFYDIDSIAAHLPVVETAPDTITFVAEEPGRSTDAWIQGMEGTARHTKIGSDSGILTILVLLFVSLALNIESCRRMFSRFFDELGSFKDRNNAFDEHTPNESRMTVLLVSQFIACSGILLYVMTTGGNQSGTIGIFSGVTRMAGLMLVYYLFQLIAYNTVGFIFTTNERRAAWIAAFNTTQSLLGLALIIPVMVAVFYPVADSTVIVIATALYFIARLLFIVKGFRIFFINYWSLLYFILYLCSLEIIPLLFVYRLALIIIHGSV